MRGGRGALLSFVLAIALAATMALAASVRTGGPPDVAAPPPLGVPEADTQKNCYLPGESITFVLRNVGTGTLFFGYVPNFVVWNETIGFVREAVDGYPRVTTRIAPGANMTWMWDGRWEREDGTHKGEIVPPADYWVIIQVLAGFPLPDLVEIARAPFSIGACEVQIGAGEDFMVDEGEAFSFDPLIFIPGNASIISISWDLDPATDANGDGNATNDVDLTGRNPEFVFGDDGIYPVVMNLRGFGVVESKTRADQDVVWAIDSSGSMATSDPSGLRKTAAKAYVDRLVPDDRVAIVDFDETATLAAGHLSMNYTAAKEAIDGIDAAGGTYLAGGMRLGLNELKDHGDADSQWLEVLISDGGSTVLRDVFEIPRAITLAQDLGVKVYTIGLRITDPDIEATMVRIANETGGRYFKAPTADAIEEIIATIEEDINKTKGTYFTVSDDVIVTVGNVDPTVAATFDLAAAPPANVTLRVAGEKWHDVSMALYRDGTEAGNVSVVRMPGSPDEQAATLSVPLYGGAANALRLVYTPLDDPVNGEVDGADPAWVNVTLANGTWFLYHHTFNVRHADTWTWEIDLTNASGGYASATLAATVADPGTDDVTVTIDWGDGVVSVVTYFNDGIGPDPYPSPGGVAVNVTLLASHAYGLPGAYVVAVTAADDDGGLATTTFDVLVP